MKKKRKPKDKPKELIEIVRSFSAKINLGNYESMDVFCSRKEECCKKDAGKVSAEAYEFCKKECAKNVKEFNEAREKKIKKATKEISQQVGEIQQEVGQIKEKYESVCGACRGTAKDMKLNKSGLCDVCEKSERYKPYNE